MEFPTPWTLELRQKFPYGVIIKAANGATVIEENACCFSTEQKTREDNELGVGFEWKNKPGKNFTTRAEASKAIASQDAKAKLIVNAVNYFEELSTSGGECRQERGHNYVR